MKQRESANPPQIRCHRFRAVVPRHQRRLDPFEQPALCRSARLLHDRRLGTSVPQLYRLLDPSTYDLFERASQPSDSALNDLVAAVYEVVPKAGEHGAAAAIILPRFARADARR
jgi:hypothetical protein